MKLVSYLREEHDQLALLVDGLLFEMEYLHPDLPGNISMFLNYWSDFLPMARLGELAIEDGHIDRSKGIPYESVHILAPVPYPGSCRDGYAFRQHVATARRNRGLPMIEAFDQFPVFYFTNHHSVQGPGNVRCMPDHFDRLDFELEAAVVICRQGRNIRAEEADAFIGGLMVMNDFSARTLQMEEMLLNLGPAKGKDFATAVGPWLVTIDELEAREVAARPGHSGKTWDLPMRCWVNGLLLSQGNLRDMDWTFAEIIERASYGSDLFPGDIIGSGTVGSGCLLELNGTARLDNPGLPEQWLQEGDKVEMEIEGLGRLQNIPVREEDEFSLLARKKSLPGRSSTMILDIGTIPVAARAHYLQHAIAPRPICFASTIDEKGLVNLSPFSFFNLFSLNPPVCIFSPSRRGRDNTTKHTLENILQVPEVVIQMLDYGMVQQASLSSCEYPRGVSEFVKAGFTEEPATLVRPPMVRESKIKMECRVLEVKVLGEAAGAGNLVLCEILRMHIDDSLLTDAGRMDQKKISLVARLGGDWYCRVDPSNLFEVEKPTTQLGIGVDALPSAIRESRVLTGNNLGQLANVTRIPEVDPAYSDERLRSIIQYYSVDPAEMESELHRYASQLLAEGRLQEAWQVLLT